MDRTRVLAQAPGSAAPVPAWHMRIGPAFELAAMLAGGVALSWLFTGHVFGRSNNVFHLPIVAGLTSEPGFAGDAFVKSLRGFASGLWWALEGRDAGWPAPTLFALGLVASKALTLFAAVLVARTVGLSGRAPTLAFIAVLATTPLLQGTAYAGHGGLFVDYFSHSELANGLTLLMWWASLRQRHGLALGLNGAVGFLNGFMAAWNIVPWLAVLLADRRARGWAWRNQAASLGAGALLALLWLAPVLARVDVAGLAGAAADVDLREFVRSYYPYHFLAGEMPLAQWVGIGAVIAAAITALAWLGARAAGLRTVLMAYGAVYAAGIVLPLVSDSPMLIRLHLLRSSVHFHFIAAIALALVLVQPAQRQGLRRALAAIALLTARPAIVVVVLAGLWERLGARSRPANDRHLPLGVAAATLVAIVAWQAATLPARWQQQRALVESTGQWVTIARQVGALTPPGSAVLLPLETESWQPPDAGSGTFEWASGRSAWVDQKRGAAVLWQAGFHTTWRTRRDEVAGLHDWAARLDYAAERQLAMVVGRCEDLPAQAVPAARAGRLCALRPAPADAPR